MLQINVKITSNNVTKAALMLYLYQKMIITFASQHIEEPLLLFIKIILKKYYIIIKLIRRIFFSSIT